MQWWVHGVLPATENFTSATNYLWCNDGSLSGVGQQKITASPPLIFFNAGFFNGGLRLFFLMFVYSPFVWVLQIFWLCQGWQSVSRKRRNKAGSFARLAFVLQFYVPCKCAWLGAFGHLTFLGFTKSEIISPALTITSTLFPTVLPNVFFIKGCTNTAKELKIVFSTFLFFR